MNVNKILLIDDEQDIRKVAMLSLQKIGGFEVIAASSGEEGLEKARNEKPDLIIVDIMMPGIDGLTVLERLRENEITELIPIIFMSARVQESDREEYLKCGACGVIVKPFDPMTLSQEVWNIAKNLRN